MIIVAYTKVFADSAMLEHSVRLAFPTPRSQAYIDEIAARKNDDSAKESLSAMLLLSRIAVELNIDTKALSLCRDKNGRPFFEDSSLDFSVTHSHGVVAVALSDSGKVGIDVEAADMSRERAKKLAERYLSVEEASTLASVEDFLRLWTEREAYVKQSGTPLADALKNGIESGVNIYTFDVFGYPASLCYAGDEEIRLIVSDS